MDYLNKPNPGGALPVFREPDTLTPRQYLRTVRREDLFTPEKQLMFAVLEDAVFCFEKFLFASDRKRAETYRAAAQWIFEAHDDWLFSFENICEALGWSPEYIRQGLKRWKTRKLAGRNRPRLSRLRARDRVRLSDVSSRVTMREGSLEC